MDQETDRQLNRLAGVPLPPADAADQPLSRRRALKYGLIGLGCAVGAGTAVAGGAAGAYLLAGRRGSLGEALSQALAQALDAPEVFKNAAPKGRLWEQWQARGWAREASHYWTVGRNIQCRLCPNGCLLEPEDRGRCRNRVHKDGKLYTLAYGNPCAFHVDPIEKKPLFHFLPKTTCFSLATSGCGFRCLNCQNWDISQRKPEETKDPRGEPLRIGPQQVERLTRSEAERGSMFPEEVVALTHAFDCPSIAYTYSEPTAWFEYMVEIAKAARQEKIKNVWVTCGYIQEEPLVELCRWIDAAHVDLKSFSEEVYKRLNSGKLEPILNTMKVLKREGVWFEVINLLVPTYTDDFEMIRQMSDWLVENLGPDCPLHFSRFHPAHKLTHLPSTPAETLEKARSVARQAGLRYVYIGNCPEVGDGGTTSCPSCKRAIVQRDIYAVRTLEIAGSKCTGCGTKIAGVWAD